MPVPGFSREPWTAPGRLSARRHATGTVRAAGEHSERRDAALPAKVEQQRGGVVRVVELAQAAVGVDAVHELVATTPEPGEQQVLAFEIGGVVVAVADGDPLADAEPRGLAEPAARGVDLSRRARGERVPGDRVSIAQAEARLAVAHARDRSAG